MPVNYQFDKKRFEAFIDAIIAILLTILVLEIKIPEDRIENASTCEQVMSLAPYIISYLASFMLIVGFWI
ncbi:MAG: TMEM175 family protein, partial [Saprospiraceae bacterium]